VSAETQLYKKVLVACDFSRHARIAFARAVEIAKVSNAKLLVAHCVSDLAIMPTASELGGPFYDYAVMQEELRQDAIVNLEKLIQDSGTDGLKVEARVAVGSPHIAISDLVEQEKIDLVVTGRSGHSGWEQFLLGSTSRGLITRCKCSVLATSDEMPRKPKSILLCTDFSESSLVAAQEGLSLAKQLGADVHLLHVIDDGDIPKVMSFPKSDAEIMRNAVREQAEQNLKQFIATLAPGEHAIFSHVRNGIAWKEICQCAKDTKVDLVVIGNVGRNGLSGLVLGNTADRVLSHSKLSILAVKHSR
jgi:universal stress protein E